MYLHLGADMIVLEKDIIGIFDLDNTTVSKITRRFLEKNEKAGRCTLVGSDIPRTFVICRDGVYLTQIASQTLMKRAKNSLMEEIR